MSQIGGPTGQGPQARRPRRAASVTLRGEGGTVIGDGVQPVGDLMDPANKSLADALRIAYKLLLVSIFVMVVLFGVSGVKEVGASMRGMRITLGKITAVDLQPGWHWSWPQPIGDILMVETNDQDIDADLKRVFFPALTENDEKSLLAKGEQGLAEGGRDYLDPDSDGALLTADGYLVHTRWLVRYTRSLDSRALEIIARNEGESDHKVRDAIERQIVTAAARRGVVVAAARMTIDEVLYSQPNPTRKAGTFRPLNVVAHDEAQKILDGMFKRVDPARSVDGGGIQIQQFEMDKKMPPRFLIGQFNAVQSAQATASKARDEAQSAAGQRLTKAAGAGAGMILGQIDQYEKHLVAAKTAEAAATLKTIHALMLREQVRIDGKDVAVNVSGDVSTLLSAAQQYRTGVVTRARGAAESYNAKLAAFNSNPQVFLNNEWREAFSTFLEQKTVVPMFLPPGLERLVLQINRDPDIDKMIEQGLQEEEAQRANERRIIERMKQQAAPTYQGVGSQGGQ